jgi:peptidoglycan hydrolase-like protein with peptidoglycan-binding domain
MSLQSELFKSDPKLEACAVRDSAHITQGTTGEQVGKIQTALGVLIPDRRIDQTELSRQHYGPSTAAAVLDYKTRRRIINFSYQTRPDDIVGKMTIAAMDYELTHHFGPIDPSDLFVPPAREQMPGFDVQAADGTIIDLPGRVGRPFDWIDLNGDPADVFIETAPSGEKLYSVVIQHNTDFPGPARTITPTVVQAIASTAAKASVRNLPKAPGFVLRWAFGKLAGGVVSVIASLLVPSPVGKEFVWTAKTGDGKLVRYTVVVIGNN